MQLFREAQLLDVPLQGVHHPRQAVPLELGSRLLRALDVELEGVHVTPRGDRPCQGVGQRSRPRPALQHCAGQISNLGSRAGPLLLTPPPTPPPKLPKFR